MSQVRSLYRLFVVQSRLCLREPIGVFFTLLLAPLLLVLMGFAFGRNPDPLFGGHTTIDVNVPTYAAIVICMVGVAMVPAQISGLRDTGALRRFRATPLRPLTYIAGDVLVNLAVALLGISVLFLLGMAVYRVPFEGDPLAMLGGISLSAAAFLAVGYALASLVPSAAAAQVLGNVLIFPMLFLSGTMVPLEAMPPALYNVSRYVPLTHVVTLLRGLWFGETFGTHLVDVLVLAGLLTVGTVIAVLAFRWE